MTPAPPTVSLARAVELCGVSRSTIQRRKAELVELGAEVTDKGWNIPIPALIGAGLLSNVTPPDAVSKGVADTSKDTPSAIPADIPEIVRLRERLADAERRAEVAEAVAEERLRSLERADVALRMLEVGKATPASAETLPRRRWWHKS